MVRTIVGANWGDEGKGKITDVLVENSDVVVRFQGGANAGHTIINDYGRFALHLLPSGVCTPGVVNVLGPGVALDIEFFLKELAAIEQQGLPAPKILISERAQVLHRHFAFYFFSKMRSVFLNIHNHQDLHKEPYKLYFHLSRFVKWDQFEDF